MPDDMYDEEASQTEANDEATEEVDKDEPSSEEALLPKSFFPEKSLGLGKVCKIKQKAIYEDEVLVEYVKHEGDSEEKPSASRMKDRMGKGGMMDETPDEMYA